MSHYIKHIFLCINQKPNGTPCCADSGGEEYFSYLKKKIAHLGLHGPGKIRVSKSGCLGRCASGPCLVIYPEGVWYSYASFADLDKIIAEHLLADKPVDELLIDLV